MGYAFGQPTLRSLYSAAICRGAGGDVAQVLVSITGIALMVGAAWLMAWYGSLPELFVVPKVAPIRDREPVSGRANSLESPDQRSGANASIPSKP